MKIHKYLLIKEINKKKKKEKKNKRKEYKN